MNGTDLLASLWALLVYHLAVVVNVAVSGCVCIIIGCRVAKMTLGVTSVLVFVQHAVLAMGMFSSVLLSFAGRSEWGAACASGGAMVFLLLSMKRWRGAPPAGTNRAQRAPAATMLRPRTSRGT